MGCGHTEHDKLSTADWIAALRPTLVEAFKSWDKQEIDQYLATLAADRELEKDRSAKRVYEVKKQLSLSSEIQTCMTTLSLDQKRDWRETVKIGKEIIDFIFSRNPTILEDAILSIEFYTTSGWNPHIHIFSYLPDRMTPGRLAQRLRKLLKEWIHCDTQSTKSLIYKVHCQKGTMATQSNYLVSLKKESKREDQEKDKQFRKENNISDYYIM